MRVRLGLFLLCLDDGLNNQTLDVVIDVLEVPGAEAGVDASTLVCLCLGFLT